MLIDLANWLDTFLHRLQLSFGQRLRFLGLQGSYGRGEATEESDIDLVVVLDVLDFDDLATYRQVVSGMPDSGRACGFICGTAELAAWPRYDLFTLLWDTQPLYGDLRTFISEPGPAQAAEGLRIGAANLYHEICHTYLYETITPERLYGIYKTAFFLMRLRHYLQTGTYIARRSDLLPLLDTEARKILTASPSSTALRPLLDWCVSILQALPS